MADLPKERMSEEPPFTYCGVDLFGSFLVKDGKKEVKRYGALYICLSSRAIHIEVLYSLSTDSFIMSLRRFVRCRGNVRMIRSDNGSNLVGASVEMYHIKIDNFLKENGAEWIILKRNPPLSNNILECGNAKFGVRAILNSLLKTHGSSLFNEFLQTLFVEVEAIINSHPSTIDVLSGVTSLAHRSPVNILTMKLRVVMPPPGHFTSPDRYCRKRWRRVQHLPNEL